jgi:lauroyl/myristoyl acyltransferase
MSTDVWDAGERPSEPTVGSADGRAVPRQTFRHLLAAPWFYRLGFAAGRRIPAPVLFGVADLLAAATHTICRGQVGVVRANLARLLPDASDRERARLAWGIFRNYARYLVDYGRFRWAPRDGFDAVIPALEGREHLQAALEPGRGLILVTGHIGNWELGGVFFGHRGVKVNVVTLPDASRQIDAIRDRYRGQYAIRTIVLDGSPFASLEMMTALKRGEMVAMLVDRWAGAEGVPATFLGATHHLPRGPFALSRTTGAPILPAFVVRDGPSYRGIVEAPFVVEHDDFGPYAARLCRTLERVIRRYPEQWYYFVPLARIIHERSVNDPGGGRQP